jgi:pimeloyl-ACP methyl ester carboxylesterase
MQEMFLDDLNGAAARGGLGAVTADLALFGRHWGFSVGDIQVPVRFWHGDADNIVPLHHAEILADRVPNAELHVRPGESHIGTLVVGDEAVRTVVGLWPRRPAHRGQGRRHHRHRPARGRGLPGQELCRGGRRHG